MNDQVRLAVELNTRDAWRSVVRCGETVIPVSRIQIEVGADGTGEVILRVPMLLVDLSQSQK